MGDYGEGSYYKQKYRDGERWIYQAYHRDSNGKIYKIRGTGADKKQARERYKNLLAKRLADPERPARESGGINLDQAVGFWLDEWQAGRALQTVTREKYRATMRDVTEFLGGTTPIKAIKLAEIERLFEELERRGIGKSGLWNRKRALTRLFNQCMKHGELEHNIMDQFQMARPATEIRQRDERLFVPATRTLDQILPWLKEQNSELYLPMLVLSTTGLRVSEMLGLEWGCLKNLGSKTPWRAQLRVKQQLEKAEHGVKQPGLKSMTKTGNERIVPINPVLQEALQRRKAEHRANSNTPEWARDLIFLTPTGRVFQQSGLGKIWKPGFEAFWKAKNITGSRRIYFRPHYLRHIFISRLEQHNMDQGTIKLLAGHSEKSRVTLKVYTHGNEEKAAEALREIFK